MNIIFVTPEFVTELHGFDGGLANYVYKTARALLEKGVTVTVLVASDKNEELIHDGIKVIRIPVRSRLASALSKVTLHKFDHFIFWSLQSIFFDRKLRSMRIPKNSVIQFPSYTVPSLFYRGNTPYVVRVSGFQPEIMFQYGTKKSSLLYRQTFLLEKKMFKKAQFLIGPSTTIAHILMKEFSVDVKIIRTSAPQLGRPNANRENLMDKKKYFLFFGTIGVLKGVGDIAEIIQDLLIVYPDYFFVFAGKDGGHGRGTMMDYLRIKAGHCSNRIQHFDALKVDQLYPLIKGAQRVILPSRFDNMPNTVIEAMSMGKIVIGTKGSSIDEMIVDGQTGFLASNSDPQNLLETIHRSLQLTVDQEFAISRAAKDFTNGLKSDKVILDLIEFYDSVLNTWSV